MGFIDRWKDKLGIGMAAEGTIGAELFEAALDGDAAAVSDLISRGANPNAKGNPDGAGAVSRREGYTALMAAASGGHEEVMRELIRAGANIDAATKDGYTALYAVSENGKGLGLDILLDAGASIAVPTAGYYESLSPNSHIRAAVDGRQMARLIEAGADVSHPEIFQYAGADAVGTLAAAGADPNGADEEFGWTALHVADMPLLGDVSPVRKAEALIAAGADPGIRDNNGNTPLHFAESRGFAEALVAAGADLKAANSRGDTPLHRAGSVAVAEALIAGGADVEARNKAGQTPAERLAAVKGSPAANEVSSFLKAYGEAKAESSVFEAEAVKPEKSSGRSRRM